MRPAAVLAAADASAPNPTIPSRWRGQALNWLHAEYDDARKKLDSQVYGDRDRAVRCLRHWQSDRDLASVRDEAARNRLPTAERDAWTARYGAKSKPRSKRRRKSDFS